MKCPLCNSNSFLLYKGSIEEKEIDLSYFLPTANYYLKYPDIYKCNKCCIIFSSLVNSTKHKFFYTSLSDTNYKKEEIGRKVMFQKIFNEIEKIKSPGKILDIGPFLGIGMLVAKERGWEVEGIELSNWAVEYAKKKYNLNIIKGDFFNHPFPVNHYDAILLFDVLEHLECPFKLLKKTHQILKEGGILVITTPNISSLISKILKSRWWFLMPPHLYYFNKRSLSFYLKKAGFRIESLKSYPRIFTLSYFLERLENILHYLKPVIKYLKKKQLSKKLISLNTGEQLLVIAQK